MRIFGQIEAEFKLTSELILKITGQQEILDNVPVIQESIRLRNPYVDPFSLHAGSTSWPSSEICVTW